MTGDSWELGELVVMEVELAEMGELGEGGREGGEEVVTEPKSL